MADYATLEELKNFLRADPADTTDDVLMGIAITAASEAIDVACNTGFPRPEITADEDLGIPAQPADAEVPSGIRLACLMQAGRWVKRRDAPFGVIGSPEMGNTVRLLRRLDPDVAVLIATYKRPWGAV